MSEAIVKSAVCPLDCADTCSLAIEVTDGQVTAVRGGKGNPMTNGKICSKVANGLIHQVYGDDRLTTPLIREGDSFRESGWDEALHVIHERYTSIIDQDGAEAIVPLAYGGPMGLLAGGSMDRRFFNKLGATKVRAGPLCAGISAVAWDSVFGDVAGIPYEELAESKLIVIWGNNITLGHLHLTRLIRAARKAGSKVVVIDPKRIRIADDADLFLPIKPGTDVVLGYAIAAELARRDALDTDFIEREVSGASAYLEAARKYSLKDAAEICGLPLADIETFVGYWQTLSPVGVSVGVAPERNRNGGAGLRTIYALAALTGNIGRPGAGICETGGLYPSDGDTLERPDFVTGDVRELNILDIPELVLNRDLQTPIQSLFIYNHNPVAVHPNQRRMIEALSREDLFIVGCDVSMTDTMKFADVVLPATSHLETGDVHAAYGHQYLQRSEAVISPLGDSLPNTEIFRRLAELFGFSDPAFSDSDQELQTQSFSPDELGGKGVLDIQPGEQVDMGEESRMMIRGAKPTTPSGKIELYSDALQESCGQGVPKFLDLQRQREFLLITPSSEHRTNSTFGGVPRHDRDLAAEINVEDAAKLSLKNGQLVRLENDLGEITLPVLVSDKPRVGVVYVPKGAWLRSHSEGHTVNRLVSPAQDVMAQGACYNDTEVDLIPV